MLATETECERYAESDERRRRRAASVTCDPFVSGKLREHQRAGARWMYRALHGIGEDGEDGEDAAERGRDARGAVGG